AAFPIRKRRSALKRLTLEPKKYGAEPVVGRLRARETRHREQPFAQEERRQTGSRTSRRTAPGRQITPQGCISGKPERTHDHGVPVRTVARRILLRRRLRLRFTLRIRG